MRLLHRLLPPRRLERLRLRKHRPLAARLPLRLLRLSSPQMSKSRRASPLLLPRHRRKAIRTTMARTMVALAHHRWRLVECLQQALALKHHRHHMRLPLQYILLFVRRRRARVDRR